MTQYSQGKGNIASIVEGRRTLLSLQGTELEQAEALAQTELGRERVEAGFIDAELDMPVPQLAGLPGSAMQMGGADSGMAMPAPRRPASDPQRPTPGTGQLNQTPPASSAEPPKGNMPGMGM